MMNTAYRKPLPGTSLDYFDARAAVEAIAPGAYDTLPYTSRVLAEKPRAPLRSGDPCRFAQADHRAQARPRFPVVPGARGVPRHPRADGARRSRRPARRDRRRRWRPREGEPGRARAVDRRPLARRRVRRLRSGRVREEPRDRGSPQRGSLPLHRVDEEGVRERRRDPAGQRHHAPDQPRENVAGDPGAGRRSVPGHLRRHRQPHAARRCARRDRDRRRRPGGGERDARPRIVDAPARHRRRRADRQAPARHHRDRRRARADRVPAQGKGGRRVSGIPWRRRREPHARRPRDDLEHGARIWRDGRDVLHRRPDDRLPAPHRPQRRAGEAGRDLREGGGPVGRYAGQRAIRAHADVRPVERGAQHGRPVEPAQAAADVRSRRTRDRRPVGRKSRARCPTAR